MENPETCVSDPRMVGCHLPPCHADGCCLTAGTALLGTANDHLRHVAGDAWDHVVQQCPVVSTHRGLQLSDEDHICSDWRLISQEGL